MHCGMSGSIPGLYPLHARSANHLSDLMRSDCLDLGLGTPIEHAGTSCFYWILLFF